MNSLNQQIPVLEQTLALRHQMVDTLTDDDLKFALPGNMTLGELCRQIGEFDHSYVESFKSFKQDWSYQHADKSVETSVEKLREWYATLEAGLKATMLALTEEQIQSQMIDRGHGLTWPIPIQFHVYRESLLVFYGKAHVYLHALGKPFTQQWQHWIG